MASSFCSSSSSSCSSSQGWRFDVFLSFHGDDVRTRFADCLYYFLVGAGIRTYRDENELPKGYEIRPELITAIQESIISIPIFSEHYVSSKWCLNELIEISECKKTKNQIVFPIFYKIEPRDVRNKKEFYANASMEYKMRLNEYQKHLIEINARVFEEHQKRYEETTVQQWKKALKEVGELDGWHLKEHMYEGKLLQEVVKTVWIALQKRLSIVSNNLVGIQSHKEKMLKLLDIESDDRKIIRVHGPGGIGKTTIARAVCSEIFGQFEEYRFIEDVREKAQKHGIEYLQNQLITDILGQEKHNITDKFVGIELIKQRFHNRKVLIVVDDVDKSDQVEFLVGDGESFRIGSRIIITSRKKDIIVARKSKTYEPDVMGLDDSLILFSHHAFRTDQPPRDYWDLSINVVKTAGGLPLALQVVGSSLYLRERSVWEEMLKKLQKFPSTSVMKSLKVSYDELDDEEQQMFLDVACFLIGKDKDIVSYFWEGCGFSARMGLDTLCTRSLLTIDEYGVLKMHDQLRDFGRHIVYEENKYEPGKRSRIWLQEEALKVLNTKTGTSTVKGLHVKYNGSDQSFDGCLTTEGFAAMTELRLLHVDYAYSSTNFTNSFSKLRWLSWKGFPSQYRLPNFHPEQLVILDLSFSQMSDEWIKHIKVAVNLKVLDLTGCEGLSRTPDVSTNLLLEVLSLKDCIKLEEMDKSICCLRNLNILDMTRCWGVEDLPSEISQWTSLKRLNLERCCGLITLPEKLGHLISLAELNLSFCRRLVELPNGICQLTSLVSLRLSACHTLQKLPEKLGCMTSLTMLDISDCRQLESVPNLPSSLKWLISNWVISLQTISVIPSSLTSLDITKCHSLRDISVLPSGLTRLCVSHCTSLVTLSSTAGGLRKLERLDLAGCRSLKEIEGVDEKLDSLVHFNIKGCEILKRIPKLRGSKYLRTLELRRNHVISDFEGEGMDSLEVLEVRNCKSLRKIPYLQDSKRLRKLEIIGCPKLSEIELLDYECLQELRISEATSLERLPADLSRLKKLSTLQIEDCGKLTHIPGLSRLESLRELKIARCLVIPRLTDLSNNLSSLKIEGCKNLSEIHGCHRLEFLEELNISDCESLERLHSLPKNLKRLLIKGCKNLTKILGFDRLEFFEELNINDCESLERLPDLSNLKNLKALRISYCVNQMDIHGILGLEFLEKLHIIGVRYLVRFPNLSKLKNLKELIIADCKNLTEIQGHYGLEFLEILNTSWCKSLQRLPDLSNFKNLKELIVARCKKLTEIHAGNELLESLQALDIRGCTSLVKLPNLTQSKKLCVLNGLCAQHYQSQEEFLAAGYRTF